MSRLYHGTCSDSAKEILESGGMYPVDGFSARGVFATYCPFLALDYARKKTRDGGQPVIISFKGLGSWKLDDYGDMPHWPCGDIADHLDDLGPELDFEPAFDWSACLAVYRPRKLRLSSRHKVEVITCEGGKIPECFLAEPFLNRSRIMMGNLGTESIDATSVR